jgi:4-amino-4-deoxy-L-arabinose transferase-like glycosyltransferase
MGGIRNFWQSWKHIIFVGLGILLLSFFLRIYDLTYLPIFGDEAIYIRWAQVMRVEPTLRFIPLTDGKQPLFMWGVIPFLKVISNPLFAGRLLSVFTGLGTTLGVFVLTHLLFKDRKVALVASLIYTISPFSVFFDRMALADSSLTFFGVWTLVFSVITAKDLRLDSAMIAGFFLGGALLTKSPGIFFAILLPASWILRKWPRNNRKKAVHLIKLIFLLLTIYFISLAMYNILRLGPNFHMIGIRNKDYVYPLTHVIERPLDPLVPFLDRSLEWLWGLGPSVFVILVAAGLLLGFKEYRKEIILLSTWAFIPLIVSAEFAKVFTARYILFIFPYLVVLASITFHNFKGSRTIIKLLFVIFIIHALWIDGLILKNIEEAPLPRSERSGYLEEWTAGTGIKETADLIREESISKPDKKIVVDCVALPDGLQIYLNDLPEITVIGTGFNITEIPISLVESKEAGNKTYFVVNSTRLLADPEDLSLKLLAAYPKAVRPDGSRETLYFFEVTEESVKNL